MTTTIVDTWAQVDGGTRFLIETRCAKTTYRITVDRTPAGTMEGYIRWTHGTPTATFELERALLREAFATIADRYNFS